MKIITYIHWRDACIEEAADPDTPISPDPLVDLYEVGYLIAETEDAVSIAMEWVPIQENNLAEPGGKPGRFRLHIPKVNIVERRDFDAEKLAKQRPRTKRK
jgi:hypothetical protein